MASLVHLARKHLLRDHGHRERKGDGTRREMGKFSLGKGRAVLCSTFVATKRHIGDTGVRGIYPVMSRKAGRRGEKEAARENTHLSAREAWAKSALISENTRRISGLIRRRLTAPIRSSDFAFTRRPREKKQKTRGTKDE